VVLEGNKRKGETWVAAKPEFERDVKVGFTVNGLTNHGFVTYFLARRLGEFVPDVHPVTVVLVNTLTTNFDLDVLDESVSEPVNPGGSSIIKGRNSNLEVNAVHEVTIAGDSACYAFAKVRGTIESLFNGFHGEVSVAAVNDLEEGNLWVTSKVNVLGTVSDKLHQSSTHLVYL
jgi:hypothetical protein